MFISELEFQLPTLQSTNCSVARRNIWPLGEADYTWWESFAHMSQWLKLYQACLHGPCWQTILCCGQRLLGNVKTWNVWKQKMVMVWDVMWRAMIICSGVCLLKHGSSLLTHPHLALKNHENLYPILSVYVWCACVNANSHHNMWFTCVRGKGKCESRAVYVTWSMCHRTCWGSWSRQLVGGFNPFEEYYCSQNGNLPQMKIKNVWNNHLVNTCYTDECDCPSPHPMD